MLAEEARRGRRMEVGTWPESKVKEVRWKRGFKSCEPSRASGIVSLRKPAGLY
mgnify:FL=1